MLISIVLFHVGLVAEARQEFKRAPEIDPHNPHALLHLASCSYPEGRFAEALELSEAAVRRAPAPWAYNMITLASIELDRLDHAAVTVDRMARELQARPASQSLCGLIAACRGAEQEARRQIALTAENKKDYGHYHHSSS